MHCLLALLVFIAGCSCTRSLAYSGRVGRLPLQESMPRAEHTTQDLITVGDAAPALFAAVLRGGAANSAFPMPIAMYLHGAMADSFSTISAAKNAHQTEGNLDLSVWCELRSGRQW